MTIFVGAPDGNKQVTARFVGDGTGATRTVSAAWIGTSAGNKQVYGASSGEGGGGGGGGGGIATPVAFGVAIDDGGGIRNLGNIHVGQTLSTPLTAVLSQGETPKRPPSPTPGLTC